MKMLDIAEEIFNLIAQCLYQRELSVEQTFGGDDVIHILPEFDGEQNVAVLTADDFMTRCYEIGLRELNSLEQACIMRVIGKPELSNAIKLQELMVLMENFIQPHEMQVPPRQAQQSQEQQDGAEDPKKSNSKKRKKRITDLVDQNPLVTEELS